MQALAQGERVTDTFSVDVSDGVGGFTTQTVTVDVVGSNDAPVIASVLSPFNGGYVVEDGAHQSASGVATRDRRRPRRAAALVGELAATPTRRTTSSGSTTSPSRKNGDTAFFNDDFSDGISPTAPGGAPAGFSYLPSGTFSESGGRAVLNGAAASSQRGVGIDALVAGHLLTVGSNIDPADLGRGLKIDDDFEVTARFDLSMPALGQVYGVSS